jgi:hypothetical protein
VSERLLLSVRTVPVNQSEILLIEELLLEILDKTAVRVGKDLANQPEVEAEL